MSSTIKLEIVTPAGKKYSGEIEYLKAPAIDGQIGILPGHAPLVTALKIGLLELRKGEERLVIPISEGFMEVTPDNINVVVRTAELPDEIDVERARRAKERAEKRLNGKDSQSAYFDYVRARAALERALARLKAADANKD
ncbi:MAG TPA: F0F1 ATP synthase subunit epsilon [Halanaerobiales bacterium]|nr:F0F1 ATP synthase subunit epsilon [Bacillota bacterium]HOA40173.1 F0F1 ATP synthase subunit epsilon [Halanaerobiales bacterium]HPZ62455.1 F0F1 ATP synthase subunit epsilon [Halanaerobiales bacterium]HQD03663.1 F0F1 ATP synthase subunit epsilon [Halanaerobiales bacterium]